MRLADDGGPLAGDPFARRLTPDERAAALAGVEALAWHLANRLAGRDRQAVDDLASAVRLGFVRAALDFDPSRGRKFITYAHWMGWQYGCRELTRHNARGLAVPDNYKVERADVHLACDTADDATGADALTYAAAPEPDGPADLGELWELIRPHVSPREFDVLARRYKDGLTLREVGERIGCTRERVRQIEAAALARLREDPITAGRLRNLLA